jgi:FlaA1/EpsC-like NDP-sugar epimerase
MSSRFLNRSMQAAADVAVFTLAYTAAYVARFEGGVPVLWWRTLAWTMPYVVAIQYACLLVFGVHRLAWRYIGLPDVRRIVYALAAAACILLTTRIIGERAAHVYWPLFRAIIPIGVTLSDAAFAFLGLTSMRVLRRVFAEHLESNADVLPAPRLPTMLIGAGRMGVMVAKEIASRRDLGILPVGFLDDDRDKVGMTIHGVPVVGTTERLAEQCARWGAQQALLTIAAAPPKELRRITGLCNDARVPVKIIPGVFEIVGGRVNLSRIRPVAIEDLLRREPVVLDLEVVRALIRGRTVLVTGAGGSIGSELCRQIARFSPASIALVDQYENNLFHIERQLRSEFPDLVVYPYIADIRDVSRMTEIFSSRRPDTVFHAAAHKHVPMMEANPREAVKNNVLGTKLIAELSDQHQVSEFVMISTDKAVNPTSVMGASKRAAEIFIQALSQRSQTRFVAVRFGNVLGSHGSVVPLFQEQIANGGPLTVTHPEMQRYFMTIPEACQLVLQAGAMGRSGEILVLDMGEPVKIVDLARDLIALSGLREGDDIEIRFTGLRPGEKLFEELSVADEQVEKTVHPKVFIGRIKPHPWADVTRFLRELEAACDTPDGPGVVPILKQFITEYQPSIAGGPDARPVVAPGSVPAPSLAVTSAVRPAGRPAEPTPAARPPALPRLPTADGSA